MIEKIKNIITSKKIIIGLSILIVLISSSFILLGGAKKVSAFGGGPVCCGCLVTCAPWIADCAISACACQSLTETPITIDHITDEFILHREWIIKVVWEAHVLPALMLMTEQLSTVALNQMMIIGTFFDAKHQLETQRLLQEMQAQAHKDYQPSQGMCQFGTTTRSLAASYRNADLTKIAITARATQRQLLSGDTISAGGQRDESRSRLDQFRNNYCNDADFGNGMGRLCNNNTPERMNRDINFTNTIAQEKILNLNFSDNIVTDDEEDVLALGSNLYGHRVMQRIPEDKMALSNGIIIPSGAYVYMKTRALAAQRSVAKAAYAAQTALKTPGSGEVQPYMQAILEEMGLAEADILEIIGSNPSYQEQMNLLTKTLYQNPKFYADLYDKPANIDRKIASMQAISLMQRRDMYRSKLRAQAIASVLLETNMRALEDFYENKKRPVSSNNEILNIEALNP